MSGLESMLVKSWDQVCVDNVKPCGTRYSIPLDPRFFRWKMLSLSGLKALVLMQLLIPFVTWSVVNVTAEIYNFRLLSLDTNRVSRDEVYLPSRLK